MDVYERHKRRMSYQRAKEEFEKSRTPSLEISQMVRILEEKLYMYSPTEVYRSRCRVVVRFDNLPKDLKHTCVIDRFSLHKNKWAFVQHKYEENNRFTFTEIDDLVRAFNAYYKKVDPSFNAEKEYENKLDWGMNDYEYNDMYGVFSPGDFC